MQWDLAGYSHHPIDGEPGQIRACGDHLGTVVGEIRAQIDQLRSIEAGEVWRSAAGGHEMFQDVIDDLPEKLDLVAIRYEKTAEALDAFYPVLAATKWDAEHNIQQAEDAYEAVQAAERRVQAMEEFEQQAQRAADTYNENRAEDEDPIEPEQWPGEDPNLDLEQARIELTNYLNAVHDAVQAFYEAATACEEALDEAGNDDLKNESGPMAAVKRAASGLKDAVVEVVDEVLDVLEAIAIAIAVVAVVVLVAAAIAMTFGLAAAPLLAVAAFLFKVGTVLGGVILAGSIFSAAAGGERDGGDVRWAAAGFALSLGGAALGRFGAGLGRLGRPIAYAGDDAIYATDPASAGTSIAQDLLEGEPSEIMTPGDAVGDFVDDLREVSEAWGDLQGTAFEGGVEVAGEVVDALNGSGGLADIRPEDLGIVVDPLPPVSESGGLSDLDLSDVFSSEAGKGVSGDVNVDIDVDVNVDIDVDIASEPSMPSDGVVVCSSSHGGG